MAIAARRRTGDASDLLGSYLGEIGRYDLLTADEEVELARAVHRGEAARERIADDEADDEELAALVEEGHRARQRFVRSNLRLVVSVARKYARGKVEMLDLIQEGNLGLMRAVERFDPEKGFRFSTYATWWIQQAIRRALAQTSSAIRIPEHVRGRLRRLKGAEEFLRSELGREPSVREIADAAGMGIDQIEELLDLPDAVSFETPVGAEGGSELGDFIEGRGLPGPADPVMEAGMRADIHAAVVSLQAREQRLLELRFGLGGDAGLTLGEIAVELGVSRQRVRQIEQRALAKLRDAQAGRLEAYA